MELTASVVVSTETGLVGLSHLVIEISLCDSEGLIFACSLSACTQTERD